MTFILLPLLLISALIVYLKRKLSYWKDRGVRYSLPSMPNPFKSPPHPKDLIDKVYQKKTEGEPFVGSFFFTQPNLVATDLDFIQNILIKDFSSFHERSMYWNEVDDPLGAHLFSIDGDKWRSLRAKLSPTFSSGKMKFMFPTIVEVAERFVAIVAEEIQIEKDLEMKDLLARFTTDVIGTCAFGIECNSLKDPNTKFRVYGNRIFTEPPPRYKQILTFMAPELARKLHVRVLGDDITDFFMSTVRETLDYREKNGIRRNDFMDLLIQLKNNDENDESSDRLSFNDIAAQTFLFFAAGFETSSTTILFALVELASNEDIQERAREEIDEVLGNYNGKLTYEAFKDMKYIDWVISETLRKYPPGFTLIRRCAKDYRIPNSNVTIEKGIRVFIPAYSIHHDPDIYSNPELFDPERFSPEQIRTRHPMSFLGFGDGPRNCIGLRFGRIQTLIGLIMLLKHFRFKISGKTNLPLSFQERSIALTPQGGVFLHVTKI